MNAAPRARRRVQTAGLMTIGLLLLCNAAWRAQPGSWRPHTQTELLAHTIYAYRQWQATGVTLKAGDRVTLTAIGNWSYSPVVGLNGAAGGRPASGRYPLPEALGGALIGRVGETGAPFLVGAATRVYADANGPLLLRINDDLLGDNSGQIVVAIEVRPAPTPGGGAAP